MPRQNRITSDADRRRIVDAFEREEDFVVVAATLGIRRTTAYEIIRTYVRTNRVERTHRGGRQTVIDNEILDFVVMLIESDPTITLRGMVQAVRDIWPHKPRFCTSTLARALDGQMITVKLCRDIPQERNRPDVKEARLLYAQWMLQNIDSHRVYVDETGFNLWTRRSYGRANRGQRVRRFVAGSRGNNTTVISAISNQAGMFYYEIHQQPVTSAIFNSFIASLEEILRGVRTMIIMDNAPIHNNIGVIYPDMQFKFLPPYSPFLNPIENCFSVFKNYLKQHLIAASGQITVDRARQRGLTLNELRNRSLRQAVHAAVPHITPAIVAINYTHANSYLERCLQREDIYY